MSSKVSELPSVGSWFRWNRKKFKVLTLQQIASRARRGGVKIRPDEDEDGSWSSRVRCGVSTTSGKMMPIVSPSR
jgi:hypothetical protein